MGRGTQLFLKEIIMAKGFVFFFSFGLYSSFEEKDLNVLVEQKKKPIQLSINKKTFM